MGLGVDSVIIAHNGPSLLPYNIAIATEATHMIAERSFTAVDQQAFAMRTGDHNPMHLDALAARRTPAGAPVVHGMHAVLWALDELAGAALPLAALAALEVEFSKFLYVGQPISLRLVKRCQSDVTAELSVAGMPATMLTLRFGRNENVDRSELAELPVISAVGETPDEPFFETVGKLSGWIAPTVSAVMFSDIAPRLCAVLGVDQVARLALLSRLVGMHCPGLHSIFTGVRVTFADTPCTRAGIGFRVAKADERFRALRIVVAGGRMAGIISALMRHPPVEMPHVDRVAPLLASAEFVGSVAVVIGGSRGLGALTAKVLAAGGANVVITYARGKAEAEAVADEINTFRMGPACQTMRFDARADLASQVAELPRGVTHLYYFATPRIFRQTAAAFCPPLFEEFSRVYLHAFYKVCQHFLATGRALSVFYPSSVFVETRPKGMTEYTMAKAAAEIMCVELTSTLPNLRIVVSRLPRILTDQTATNLKVTFADPLAVMLPLIRQTQNGAT
jgi:acyl dehydratase/NAD(P)-dependent dehydrogenase (short-subunit alcohol dehydrogenase family)